MNQQKVVRLLAVQFECFSTESISGYNREITATDCAAAAAISHWVVYKWNWLHLRPVISEEKNKFCSPNKNRNKNGKKRKKKWRGFDVVTWWGKLAIFELGSAFPFFLHWRDWFTWLGGFVKLQTPFLAAEWQVLTHDPLLHKPCWGIHHLRNLEFPGPYQSMDSTQLSVKHTHTHTHI